MIGMHIEAFREYCIAKKGVTEEFPFDDVTLVFKVMGKMFALIPVEPPLSISLKCDPILAEILRETYDAVQPGYHLNKRHWNTVVLDGSIDDGDLAHFIDHSYELVVAGLPKSVREKL